MLRAPMVIHVLVGFKLLLLLALMFKFFVWDFALESFEEWQELRKRK